MLSTLNEVSSNPPSLETWTFTASPRQPTCPNASEPGGGPKHLGEERRRRLRTSPSLCCSTQLGLKAFRWAGSDPRRCPAHLRGRHLSLQLSRQLSVRSLPSPKALGPGRSTGPPQGPDPLQLPDHDLEHHFQGTARAEDGRDGPGKVDEDKPTPTNS